MSDLNSCPFCGNADLECGHDPDASLYRVECNCGACGPDGKTEQEAIDAWNRRILEHRKGG